MRLPTEAEDGGRSGISKNATIVVLVVILVAAAALVYFSSGMTPGYSTTHTSSHTVSSVQIAAPVGVGLNQALNFEPSTIRVVIGVNNTITFVNEDSTNHDIASTSVPNGASTFDTGTMAHGSTFSVTLTVAGTYLFHCTFHPAWMQGKIVVVQG